MTKLVRIDELTYTDLVHITGEIMATLKKPWSLGMSVRMAVAVLEEYMKTDHWKGIMEDLKKQDLGSPEDWMNTFETIYKAIITDKGSAGP